MEFDRYIKVYTLISYDEVNKYLDVGWKLLFVGQYADDESKHISFAVGWPDESGTPKEPKGREEYLPKYGTIL